ncbi:MAG TPA: hypothetical protein VGV93_07300, partial [Acidimicrobiales bacterium]|nr:hypothetical protein [Acidimicrobiales bacterium]
KGVAHIVLDQCGFRDIRAGVKVPGLGVELAFTAVDHTGRRWAFDLSGAFTTTRSGLKRSDALWKALGTAAVLHSAAIDLPSCSSPPTRRPGPAPACWPWKRSGAPTGRSTTWWSCSTLPVTTVSGPTPAQAE